MREDYEALFVEAEPRDPHNRDAVVVEDPPTVQLLRWPDGTFQYRLDVQFRLRSDTEMTNHEVVAAVSDWLSLGLAKRAEL